MRRWHICSSLIAAKPSLTGLHTTESREGGALVVVEEMETNHVTPVFVLETPDGLSKNVRVLGREH